MCEIFLKIDWNSCKKKKRWNSLKNWASSLENCVKFSKKTTKFFLRIEWNFLENTVKYYFYWQSLDGLILPIIYSF